MVASRQDAWTEDDDLVLAEVTLRHIREGGTQLAAFEEVGQRLGRTAAACGFRWNSSVRKRYEAAIAIAKGQRQQLKKMGRITEQSELLPEEPSLKKEMSLVAPVTNPSTEEQQIEAAIRLLMKYKETLRRNVQLEQELEEKQKELDEIKQTNQKMKKELETIQGVNDDYQALIQIMERARKLAFLKEEETSKPVFKMDSNGNLERIE
ncbi:RsfA family transcriptional regulator [Brevibacillus fulvus]|uniref:Prespore-specific regulator n=1 Tax=Brevibacillus fulvus TaxID=1125967 RepID=A0A938XX72_9BACL|nr:RsfA family transcriptional regulator [Brevibacillus fulvus]MBM7589303.1 prespore-specific regulator [Brevibacillus fulvus]